MTSIEKLQELAGECKDLTARSKINEALSKGDFAGAAIRISHIHLKFRISINPLKRDFNPNEARDEKGRWTPSGSNTRERLINDTPSVRWCKIVKQLCIVEATDTLQTSDFGFQFWNAMNACMDRHGCLGVA